MKDDGIVSRNVYLRDNCAIDQSLYLPGQKTVRSRAKRFQGRAKLASRSKGTGPGGPGDWNEGRVRHFRRADFRVSSVAASSSAPALDASVRTGSQRDQRHRVRRNAR